MWVKDDHMSDSPKNNRFPQEHENALAPTHVPNSANNGAVNTVSSHTAPVPQRKDLDVSDYQLLSPEDLKDDVPPEYRDASTQRDPNILPESLIKYLGSTSKVVRLNPEFADLDDDSDKSNLISERKKHLLNIPSPEKASLMKVMAQDKFLQASSSRTPNYTDPLKDNLSYAHNGESEHELMQDNAKEGSLSFAAPALQSNVDSAFEQQEPSVNNVGSNEPITSDATPAYAAVSDETACDTSTDVSDVKAASSTVAPSDVIASETAPNDEQELDDILSPVFLNEQGSDKKTSAQSDTTVKSNKQGDKSTLYQRSSKLQDLDEKLNEDELKLALKALDDEAAFKGETIIQVVVDRAVDRAYTYLLEGRYGNEIIGCRVSITFGRSSSAKGEIGFIVGIGAKDNIKYSKLKHGTLVDESSLIDEIMYQTMLFTARYYHFQLGQTLPLAVPKLLRQGLPASYRTIPGFRSNVAPQDLEATLKSLRSNKAREMLTLLQQRPKRKSELTELGFSQSTENTLLKHKLITKIDLAQELPRFDLQDAAMHNEILASEPFKLNEEQQKALSAINNHQGYGVFLLAGVTGSGKTEVYLQAIEHTLKQGKKAMVLVPEISLTPQTFKRFYQRFKVPITTMHSTLSDRERLDAFLDMKNERAVILIGTRSSIFTSISNLGLIVIDEEHDSSFKQNDTLRYHTRTIALFRAKLSNCKVVLGSATPSIESIFNAYMGNFQLLTLYQRAKAAAMPKIVIVNLRQEAVTGNLNSGVGNILENAIGVATAQHNQVLLFLNRRGFSHALLCTQCGKVVTCPRCDNPLTVHRQANQLRCHICDYFAHISYNCPYCNSQHSLIEVGLGTEQVAMYLQERFLDEHIERIDRDVITNKESLEKSLQRVIDHESNIMVGTQMLAKGHDFPDVTVVGILDLDSALFCDDYHALEYATQLIVQVAGRAGRAGKESIVYIQTSFPDHALWSQITSPGFQYLTFAQDILKHRRELYLPPFTFQANLLSNAYNREEAFNCLRNIFVQLQSYPEALQNVVTSAIRSDRIEKRANRYHFHVTLTASTRQDLDRALKVIVQIQSTLKTSSDLRFAIDVDPIIRP